MAMEKTGKRENERKVIKLALIFYLNACECIVI